MDSSSQSAVALLGLWVLFLVLGGLLVVGGFVYALYCLGRIGSQLERLAGGLELANARELARDRARETARQTQYEAERETAARNAGEVQ